MSTSGVPDGSPQQVGNVSELATPEGAAADSLSVAMWTFVSRFTGLLRGIMIAAVLGATYFANTYQFTNSLPNFIFYGLLAGSLFSSLLVPALVHHIDSGNREAVARTAGGLLGVALLGMLAIVPVIAVLTPWLLRLGSIGASGAAHDQTHIGALLVLFLLPQVPLYAVVGTATAVMNAHRRFALAAAAPALENLGTMAVLVVVAVLYSRAATRHDIPLSLLLLLGLGTTGAVMLHASTQWWGARRAGVVLVPNAGWRDPQVRATIQPGPARGGSGRAGRRATGRADADGGPGSGRCRGVPAGDELLLPADSDRRHAGRALTGAAAVENGSAQPGRPVPRHLHAGPGPGRLLCCPGGSGLRCPRPFAGGRDRGRRFRRVRPGADRGGVAGPGASHHRRDPVPGHDVRLLCA